MLYLVPVAQLPAFAGACVRANVPSALGAVQQALTLHPNHGAWAQPGIVALALFNPNGLATMGPRALAKWAAPTATCHAQSVAMRQWASAFASKLHNRAGWHIVHPYYGVPPFWLNPAL